MYGINDLDDAMLLALAIAAIGYGVSYYIVYLLCCKR